ncbi:hypothetical protein H4R26_004618, partial [Coemansia thaxteri]
MSTPLGNLPEMPGSYLLTSLYAKSPAFIPRNTSFLMNLLASSQLCSFLHSIKTS